ncbi:MAG: hypothetical protein HYX61_05075 [Gammaproteobacteria bacterium]|nr:hypothetical protein [Gammaproteobacteria bacterium]
MLNLELMGRSVISQQVHGDISEVQFDHKPWQIVNSKTNWVNNANKQWVSLGSSKSRERLFFDENSPVVTELKAQALLACKGKDIATVLDTVNALVNDLTAQPGKSRQDVERSLDAQLEELLREKRKTLGPSDDINIHFDELVEKKILVCRHKGLLAASILAHLVENNILPQGCVRQYRSSLKINDKIIGAHTWSVYRNATTGDLWMCDPRWQTAKNVTQEYNHLAARYGNSALSDMVKRLDVEDRLLLIEEVVAHEQAKEELAVTEERKEVEEPKAIVEKQAELSEFDAWAQGKATGKYQFGYYTKYLLGYGSKPPVVEEKSDYDKWVEGDKSAYHFGYYAYWALKGKSQSPQASCSAEAKNTTEEVKKKTLVF